MCCYLYVYFGLCFTAAGASRRTAAAAGGPDAADGGAEKADVTKETRMKATKVENGS